MVDTEATTVSLPAEVCGCVVDRALSDNQSFLAVGPGGRNVVLKAIDPDCMLRGSLHPSVRDRLSRVRELAHSRVANLFGVEREDGIAYLMWEYVEGIPFDEFAAGNRTPREITSAARELVLAVDLLHMQGIIHGALIGSNVIVTPGGGVRLTHISPLIYTEPSADIDCLWDLISNAADQLGEPGAALAALVAEAREQHWTLRQLSGRLGAMIDSRTESRSTMTFTAKPTATPRRMAVAGAAIMAVAGMAAAWGIWRVVDSGRLSAPEVHHLPLHASLDR